MSFEDSSPLQHSKVDQRARESGNDSAPIFLLPDEQRAYDAIVKDYKVLKVPDYFIDKWVPLLDAAEGWVVLSFRQLAFVVRSKDPVGTMPAKATLRSLARWSGLTFQHVGKVLKRAEYLHWFVHRQDGASLGQHPGRRSKAPIYLVRIEVPLTPADQARLVSYLQANLPSNDKEWLQLLHRAISAKKNDLPDGAVLPSEPKTIDGIVRDLRNPAEQLPNELELACVELHNRWVTTNFRQVTHYFIKRFLPHLTPSLAFLIVWARKHAQRDDSQYPTGELRISGWNDMAEAVNVAPYSVSRWLSDKDTYPHSRLFFTDIYEEQSGEGEIDDINEDSIIVSGIPVQVDPSTEINEPLYLGDRVKYSAIRDLNADTETTLVARRIQQTQETRVEYLFKKEGLLLQVRISEPIHPDDMERYERLRSSLETDAPFGNTTKSDKVITVSDMRSTKDDYLETQSDEDLSEVDKDPAESDTSRTKGDIEPTETDIKRTDSDALRHLLRDSPKIHSKEESYKQQLQEHTHTLKNSIQQQASVNVAVAVSSSWDISKILTEAAIRKSDRRPIEKRWDELQQAFVAWLLWSLATKTIESPVLHTVSRIKDRDPPPEGFLDLAVVTSDKIWMWLLGDMDEVPDQYYETVQLLREQGADQALLRIGFDPSEFSRDEDVELLVEDDAYVAVPDSEEIDDSCGTLIGGRTARDTWVAALGQLQMEIPKASFDTWLRDAEIVGYSEGVFEIGVQNTYARDWLDDRLKSTAGRVLTGVVGEKMKVRFVVM
jgi:hypothetical protein